MLHCTKTVVLVVFSVLCSLASYGQVKLGVKAGCGVAGLHQEPEEQFSSSPRHAFHLGLFTQITRYQSRFFIRPELLYSIRGFYMKTPAFNKLITLNYFSIPILFGFKPMKKIAFLAGIEPGFMTGFSTPFYNNYRTNDVAVNVGVSYDITYNMGIELRGGAGLFSLMEIQKTNEQGQQTSTNAGYNHALQLTFSYNFAQEGLSDIAPVLRKKKADR